MDCSFPVFPNQAQKFKDALSAWMSSKMFLTLIYGANGQSPRSMAFGRSMGMHAVAPHTLSMPQPPDVRSRPRTRYQLLSIETPSNMPGLSYVAVLVIVPPNAASVRPGPRRGHIS